MHAFFWIVGVINVANGLWMLAAPTSWYYGIPAAVPDTGPLNLHFVRDLGAAFTTFGVAFCATAPRAERHRGLVLVATLFFGLHAGIHVVDLLSGHLHGGHWLIDTPLVFVPAVLLGVACLPRWWPAATD